MKRFRLTLPARIAIACAVISILYLIASHRGMVPSAGDTFFSKDIIDNANAPLTVRIGVIDLSQIITIVGANGGLTTIQGSEIAKQNISCVIEKFGDIRDVERAFLAGKINVMATTAARFGASHHSLKSKSPAVFFLSGNPTADCALFSRVPISGSSSLKGKSIICAERSESHLFALFMAECAGIAPKEIDWHFTNSDEETASLFSSHKGDIAVVDLTRIKSPSTLSGAVIRSSSFPYLFKTILVIREGLIAAHNDTITALLSAAFKERDRLASMKNSDATSYLSRIGISNPLYEKNHPAQFTSGVDDNNLYFRLTQNRTWDFCREFTLAQTLDDTDFPMADEMVDSIPLSAITQGTGKKLPAYEPPYNGNPFILIKKEISFADAGTLLDSSRYALKMVSLYAAISPSAQVAISVGNPASSYTATVREQSVRDLLIKEYGMSPQKIVTVKADTESISLILSAGTK